MKQDYCNSMIYHTNREEKKKFMEEINKRYPSMSKFAKAVVANPEEVFKN